MSTPGNQTNYHHATTCHCPCHRTHSPQPSQAQPIAQRVPQSNVPGQTELSQLVNGIQDYFRSLYTPPQIRVTRSGFWSSQSMVFGRQSLSKLNYDEAELLFRSIFESENDKSKIPSEGKGSEKTNISVIPSIIEIHATFLREPRGVIEASAPLHRSAWPEVVENVKALSIVFRKGKAEDPKNTVG